LIKTTYKNTATDLFNQGNLREMRFL